MQDCEMLNTSQTNTYLDLRDALTLSSNDYIASCCRKSHMKRIRNSINLIKVSSRGLLHYGLYWLRSQSKDKISSEKSVRSHIGDVYFGI